MKNLIKSFFVFTFLAVVSIASATNDSKPEAKAPAATSIMSGTVLDAATGEALVGAVVEVEGTDLKTYTDLNGEFTLNEVKVGACNLKVNYISYREVKVNNIQLTQESNVVEVKLNPEGL